MLSSGEGALQELAGFVRELAQQVRYLKLVTIYGLELLAFEMAWAVYWAGATAGASMAWLAARFAVMRFLLSRWWGQLFMRLAMAAAGGVAFNVVPDLQAQLQMLGEKSSEKWDGKLTEQAAGMGAFSALVSLPLSAVGGLVSNALTKVLVRGLGDDVDEKILEAAAKRAVAEHAEFYPVSAMARFADAVGEHLDHYAGMSVRGMWSARFGSGIGEALSEGLGELFGEVGYQAATGQEVTWNPYSVTAGVFESVFSGVGNLTGLAFRGKLHPEGPSPYLDDASQREGATSDGGGFGAEKAPLPGAGSGSQTGNIPGSPDKDSTFTPSDASDASDGSKPSDVDSVLPVGPVNSAAVPVSSGKDPVVSAVVDGKDSKDVKEVTGGTDVKGGKEGADGSVPARKPTRDVPLVPGSGQERQGTPLPAHSDGVVGSGQDRQGTPPPVYSPEVVGSGQDRQGTPPPVYSGEVPGSGQDRHGTPLSAHFDGVVGSGQDRQDPPPPYSAVAGGDQAVPGAHGVDVPGNRPLGVHASQTPDSPAVTPDASGVPADAALPETGRSGSVMDSDGGVPAGQPTPSGSPGRDGDSHVDSVAGHGDSHRLDVAAASSDSATPSADGSQVAPDPHQDPAAAVPAGVPAGVPVGVPVDAVRVPVPADVVAGGGLAEFVRGGVADSSGGPVLLVAQGNPAAGVVVSPGQGSALAQGMGRDVVAVTPGQGGRGPQWTVFGADGSARPVAGPGAPVPVGGHGGVAGLADASAAVPVGPAGSGRAVVGQWSGTDLRGEIDRARDGRRSGGDESAARRIVQGTHDIAGLARGDAAVSLEDVVALVAAKHHELGDAHQDQVVEFSQALADRLGTQGSGLTIHAGAGPEDRAGRSEESAAGWSSGQSGGPSQRHAAVPVDEAASGAGHQTEREERAELIEQGRARLEDLEAQKAELEKSQERAWDHVRQAKLEELSGRIATVQAEVDTLANREAALRVWDERYERAEAQLDEWSGIAGRGAVDRLLADADGILGPLAVSERFRMVLAQWLGEYPGDWRGAQAVRGELAGYLAGDPDFGVAVSGLPRGAFEEARAEETRWQADRAGDQAEAAAPMVRGVDDDPALRVISEVGSVKRTFADAGMALRQLADEQGQDVVDGLYAAADEVLGALKESQPFRDVMAHELMTNPPNLQGDQQSQQSRELRSKLVRYLTGDLSGGADPTTAGNLLSATATRELGSSRSESVQMYRRRMEVGKAVSGLPDDAAVDRLLRNEALEDTLRSDYTSTALGARFNRAKNWGAKVLGDVKKQLSSDLQVSVGSLRQILAEAESDTDQRNEYEAKIAKWLDLKGVHVRTIRRRVAEVEEAAAALRGLPEQSRKGPALLVWDERYERAEAQLHEWAGIAGRGAVDRLLADADGILGPLTVSEQFRNVLAHWLGEHPGDWRGAQAVRGELANYLAGDPAIGVAVSGLPPGAFEAVKAEETRWQADRAGDQAEAAAPMVRRVDDDPGLRVISEVSSVKRTFADAGMALRQLAYEQGQGVVDGLYAAADEVLGALKESQPFRDVMAHELMTNPPNPQGDQQSRELRSKLVRYLTGDLSGGADPTTTDNLLSATVTSIPGNKYSEGQQMLGRRVAVALALSGLPDEAAVDRLLRNAAHEDALREDYVAAALGARFNRSKAWANKVVAEVRDQLISDLEAAVGSLRQILAEAEADTDQRNEYEAKIEKWLRIHSATRVKEIRSRAAEAVAAVREVREWRRNNAIQELWEIFDAADGGLAQLKALHGRDHVGRAFAYVDLHFGGVQDDQSRKAVAHRLLTNGGQIWDAQAFLERLHHLKIAASAVIAGAGPEPGRDLLSESTEDVSSDAETDDTESVSDEAERAELLERLDRLRGDAEPSESHRSSGLREFGGRSARSDEEFLAGDSESSVADVRGEIDRAREGGWSGDDELAARRIVQGTHDVRRLARGDAAVSLEDVVTLVAAKHHELGNDHQDQAVEFSQLLAENLGTQGTGPTIRAGAGPADRVPGLEALQGREREALQQDKGKAQAELDTIVADEKVRKAKQAANFREWSARKKRNREARVTQANALLEEAEAGQASLEALPGFAEVMAAEGALPGFDAALREEWEALQRDKGKAQAELDTIVADDKRRRGRDAVRSRESYWRKKARAAEPSDGGVSSSASGSPTVSLPGAVRAEVVTEVVELAGLVGRVEERLAALPADFRPDVRAQVAAVRNAVQQEGWTPKELQRIGAKLDAVRTAVEEHLRNIQSPEDIPAGIMMSSDLDEDVRVVARGLPVEDGRLAVVVKGDGRGGVLIGGKSADASQLASLIRGRVRGNRSIRLYDAQGASEGFAQALDRALGVEVIWAPGNVFGPEANGWYLDDLLMMRPEFNVTWNTTRRDDSPPGQSPSDGPLPPAASEPRDSGMSEQVLGSGVAEIPAGIMMSPSDMDEDLRAAARHLPVEDGRLAVVVKGDGRGGILIGGESANASQLAILIRRSVYGQRSIRLYACGVSEEFAQALDEASGVEVIWTRGIVWFGPETNGFASTVSGWYLDELFMLRPDFSQGAWETTRSGEWPRGQSPSDVSLPSGLPGLSPHWVHLRAETARFRAEPLADLALLRESGQAAQVAEARREITTAGDQLSQIYSLVDVPVPEVPPTTVTAADSAETDALLKAVTEESTSAAGSVGRAQRQAERLTAAQRDLMAARQWQADLRAELDAARQDLIQKRAALGGPVRRCGFCGTSTRTRGLRGMRCLPSVSMRRRGWRLLVLSSLLCGSGLTGWLWRIGRRVIVSRRSVSGWRTSVVLLRKRWIRLSGRWLRLGWRLIVRM
ncbi:hypothetical protein [Saccharopolyspora spinosa]|uniref:hypothetical protein n=1 Tax=Saccharopolyspora spinosa TaxID=60894 RepID=UPI00376EAF33